MTFSLIDICAAGFCIGLLIDYRKNPEKYGNFSASLNIALYTAITVFVCTVLYELMQWMPYQGVATIVRAIAAVAISIVNGCVFKKHENTLNDDAKKQLLFATIFCVVCVCEILVAAIVI